MHHRIPIERFYAYWRRIHSNRHSRVVHDVRRSSSRPRTCLFTAAFLFITCPTETLMPVHYFEIFVKLRASLLVSRSENYYRFSVSATGVLGFSIRRWLVHTCSVIVWVWASHYSRCIMTIYRFKKWSSSMHFGVEKGSEEIVQALLQQALIYSMKYCCRVFIC